MSLGPGIPDPPAEVPVPLQSTSHCTLRGLHVLARPFLGGLHHEYGLIPEGRENGGNKCGAQRSRTRTLGNTSLLCCS